MKKEISGIGTVNIDILYQGLNKIPDIGEEVYSKNFDIQLGGGLPGVLTNLSRLGVKTNLITEIGNDIFSNFAKAEFEKNNISPINIYKGNYSPVNITSALILNEDRSFVSYGPGSIKYSKEKANIFYNYAKDSKIILMQKDEFIDVYKKLKENGCILIFDSGWDENMSIESYKEYLEIADFYTPNQKEALKISNTDNVKDAAKILKQYFDKVVIKLDKDGCLGYDDEIFYIPTLNEYKAIDSTGAGDAFLAGFSYGILNDYSFKNSILLGNITGGKSVTGIGALKEYYNEKELLIKYNEAV